MTQCTSVQNTRRAKQQIYTYGTAFDISARCSTAPGKENTHSPLWPLPHVWQRDCIERTPRWHLLATPAHSRRRHTWTERNTSEQCGCEMEDTGYDTGDKRSKCLKLSPRTPNTIFVHVFGAQRVFHGWHRGAPRGGGGRLRRLPRGAGPACTSQVNEITQIVCLRTRAENDHQ